MKALYIAEPMKIELIETEKPIPKPNEALIKIAYGGICGADVLSYLGKQPFTTYPRIPGHEFSGTIADIGANSRGLREGMAVTANPYFNCGHCYPCEKGKVNCCESNQTMGVQRDGAFAEYIVMPMERIYDGKGLSCEQLALIEPFSISFHAINRGDVQRGDKVLVVGAGPIGIFAAIAAKMRGAEVYITDLLDQRLALAKEMGADGTVNCGSGNLHDYGMQVTHNHGFDVCVEACGISSTFLACIDEACFGGKVVLIGNGKSDTTFNHSILLKKELSVYGSRNSVNDFEPLIELVASGKVDVMKMVSAVYPLPKAADAFKALVDNKGDLAKVLIRFEG